MKLLCFRLKEQRERSDVDHQEELARCESALFEATSTSAEIQTQLDEKQACLSYRDIYYLLSAVSLDNFHVIFLVAMCVLPMILC